MKEKVLKVLWWAWMLLPIGLACFILPVFPAILAASVMQPDGCTLLLLGPLVMATGVYYFYKKRTQCSTPGALHAAALSLLFWFFISDMFADTIAQLNPTVDSYSVGYFITGVLIPILILGGHYTVWSLIRQRSI